MNSHNQKPDVSVRVAKVRIESDQDDIQVVETNLLGVDQLAISDDNDPGGDPYNSTGQHVILKSKRDQGD